MDNYQLTKHYLAVLDSGADILYGPLSLCNINKYINRSGYQVHSTRLIGKKEFSQIYDSPETAVREFLKLKDRFSKKT